MTEPLDRWWSLPDATRTQVLSLLAALIARGVLVENPVEPLTGAGGDDV